MTIPLIGQSLSSENVGSTGGTFNANGYSLTWSVGEIATETIGNSANKLTQGFNQPASKSGSSKITSITAGSSQVFPNPFSDAFTIIPASTKIVKISIKDIAGREVQNLQSAGEINVDMTNQPAGIYLLSIQIENQPIETVKIIKK